MDVKIEIKEHKGEKDYFPSLFTNKDNTIVILADSRTSDKTFSGMIISSTNKAKGYGIGTYETSWTYVQFHRLPKYSTIHLDITQDE